MRETRKLPTAAMTAGLLFLLLTAFLAPSLPAAELAGVTLEDSVQAAGQDWALNGLGLRKKAIFKVYVAGLYLPEKNADAEAILAADAPRRMVMQFTRGVSANQLCDGWNDGLKGNTPEASDAVKKDFETLCGYMDGVKSDEQVVFTYLPESGTEVAVKGTVKGTIEGKAFADALFACWLGPKPPGESFKEGILGKE